MSSKADEQLAARLRDEATREAAFRQLVERYQAQVYRVVRRLVIDHDDADDLVQTTFIKAWRALDRFRGDSKLSTWLYRIATNEALTFLRRKRRVMMLPLVDVEGQLARQLTADDPLLDADEVQRHLQLAILRLPEKQRVVFQFRYFDELPYEDISEILGTSVGALKASYHHAARKVEAYFKDIADG